MSPGSSDAGGHADRPLVALQAVLGGNETPSKDDITSILSSGEPPCGTAHWLRAELVPALFLVERSAGQWLAGACSARQAIVRLLPHSKSAAGGYVVPNRGPRVPDGKAPSSSVVTPSVCARRRGELLRWRCGAVGIDAEGDKIDLLLKEVEGKDVNQLISEGAPRRREAFVQPPMRDWG